MPPLSDAARAVEVGDAAGVSVTARPPPR
jgi:hypothetical protein